MTTATFLNDPRPIRHRVTTSNGHFDETYTDRAKAVKVTNSLIEGCNTSETVTLSVVGTREFITASGTRKPDSCEQAQIDMARTERKLAMVFFPIVFVGFILGLFGIG